MHCYFVAESRAAGLHTAEEERAFQHADTTFKATILSVLGVASGFKNKTRYTPYVSLGSQISYIAINKGNIKT